eukprot:2140814-Amphidinium_carterae.1
MEHPVNATLRPLERCLIALTHLYVETKRKSVAQLRVVLGHWKLVVVVVLLLPFVVAAAVDLDV